LALVEMGDVNVTNIVGSSHSLLVRMIRNAIGTKQHVSVTIRSIILRAFRFHLVQ